MLISLLQGITASWNGPDRAGFLGARMRVPVTLGETQALVLVCSRLASALPPDMVLSRTVSEVIENHSCGYKLMRQYLVLVRN